MTSRVSWSHPTPLAVSLATCAGLALALAVALGHPQLAVFAAPMIGLVAVGGRAKASSVRLTVTAPETDETPTASCFESESLDIRLDFAVTPETAAAVVTAQVGPVEGLSIETRRRTATSTTVRLRPRVWGRYAIPVQTTVRHGGLTTVRTHHDPIRVLVYPRAVPGVAPEPDVSSRTRIGSHHSRARGSGMDFANVRDFAPGDALRSVNWRATARRGDLQVTERYSERSRDVVIVFDATLQRPGYPFQPLDRAVRAATELTWSALRAGDRVGLVRIGDRAGWCPVRGGRGQFYDIVTALLDPDGEAATPFSGTVPPQAAVPAATTVVAFSGLLDSGFALSLFELRKRGHRVIAVDVMPQAMFTDHPDPLVARLWSLERAGLHRDIAAAGIEVVSRGDDIAEPLDAPSPAFELPRQGK
ncbi:DUF58 domain-containing protein [Nocardia asteroides]